MFLNTNYKTVFLFMGGWAVFANKNTELLLYGIRLTEIINPEGYKQEGDWNILVQIPVINV